MQFWNFSNTSTDSFEVLWVIKNRSNGEESICLLYIYSAITCGMYGVLKNMSNYLVPKVPKTKKQFLQKVKLRMDCVKISSCAHSLVQNRFLVET